MAIELYELVGRDDRRFSPYCWRTRMALEHKGLDYKTIPVRFTDKDLIAFSGQGRIPVIKDGETVVSDSWAIAEYLEQTYGDRPSLFGGETGQQLAPIVEQLGNSQTVQQTEQRELTAQEKEMGNFMATVLADTEDVWNQIFTQNNIGDYKEPTMVLFTDAVSGRA